MFGPLPSFLQKFRKSLDASAEEEIAVKVHTPANAPALDVVLPSTIVDRSIGHRNELAAEKLATALSAKYLFELNPSRSHKSNVHGLLARELHDLTRQALAFRTARLPPRVLCRLNAFIANLCAAGTLNIFFVRLAQ